MSGASPAPDAPSGSAGRSLRALDAVPVTTLRSLKGKKVDALEAWGVHSILDLVTTFPRRHVDRTRRADLADLAVGDEAVVLAEVKRSAVRRGRAGKTRVELDVSDHSGFLRVVFFNQQWRTRQLPPGSQALFSGKLTEFRETRQMVNPIVDLVVGTEDDSEEHHRRTLRVVPIYPASAKAGLTSWEIGGYVAEALERTRAFLDPLPQKVREELGMVERTTAMWGFHLPDSVDDIRPARRRLVFDELFRLQLALVLRRRVLELDARAIRHDVSPADLERTEGGGLVATFLSSLPYSLTGAQRRALGRIFEDLAGPLPMHQLLQGDVGSGKTVVALAAMLAGVQGGHQGALMVPTEVLAEQHLACVRSLVEGLSVKDPSRLTGERPVSVRLLTAKAAAKERAEIKAGLAEGSVDLVVGTQALLTDDVTFHSLGVVVIDEQHRFGVEQRAALRAKGRGVADDGADPDLLVMTATPIPRTAAMVVFGDLDMTVLDEMPPGRSPITTTWARTPLEISGAYECIRREAAQGRRAFVVCPLVEGSDTVQARSAVAEFERLGKEELQGLRLGLLHGQMPSAEKEAVMGAFRAGELEVLVATTVIEVGIDVPEATVMVIEDAHRFGISQLHQLRGRVGRGGFESWCYLLGDDPTQEAHERLSALERTTDGFELAEVDLELRGAGTLLGARQKGRSDLQIASLTKKEDVALLGRARAVAEALTESDPRLEGHPDLEDEMRLFLDEEEAEFLFKS